MRHNVTRTHAGRSARHGVARTRRSRTLECSLPKELCNDDRDRPSPSEDAAQPGTRQEEGPLGRLRGCPGHLPRRSGRWHLLPEGTAELDAANSGLRGSQDQVDRLDSDLAAAKLRNATLSESLEEAKDEAAAAGAKSQAAQKRLDAREAKLDEREHALEQREEDLGTDENSRRRVASAVDAPTGVEFDRAYAIDIGNDIVHDIKTVDAGSRWDRRLHSLEPAQ